MDILKHGESAYPADAWVEQQYMKEEINNVQIPGTPNLPRQDSTDTNITSVGAREEVSRKTSTLSLSSKNGLPPHMKYSRSASYNNPHEMFPSESKLFTGMTQLAGNITVNIDGPKTGTYNMNFRIDLSGPILRSQLMVVFSGICKYKPGYVSHDLL